MPDHQPESPADRVFIPCDDGTGRTLSIYQACDSDFHVSVLPPGHRMSRNSVRICTGQGNPNHRELWKKLSEVFEEALNLGYWKEPAEKTLR